MGLARAGRTSAPFAVVLLCRAASSGYLLVSGAFKNVTMCGDTTKLVTVVVSIGTVLCCLVRISTPHALPQRLGRLSLLPGPPGHLGPCGTLVAWEAKPTCATISGGKLPRTPCGRRRPTAREPRGILPPQQPRENLTWSTWRIATWKHGPRGDFYTFTASGGKYVGQGAWTRSECPAHG